MLKCRSGKHEWTDEDRASRCCNGWVIAEEPWFGMMMKLVLVRENDLARLEELANLRIKTELCQGSEWPWIFTEQ